MTLNFSPVQTNVGYAAMITSRGNGQNWRIVAIAIGDANGAGYVPTVEQTELKNEKMRMPIISGEAFDNGFRVAAQFAYDALVGEFENREVGFYMQVENEPPVLFAVYSEVELLINIMTEATNAYIPAYTVIITRGTSEGLVFLPADNASQIFNLPIVTGMGVATMRNSLTILKQIDQRKPILIGV